MRCDAALRALIRRNLTRFVSEQLDGGERGAAAVALAVAHGGHGAALDGLPSYPCWCDEAALILTRRAAGMRNHPGQWALPGGRIDPGETPEQTALRELEEEIALDLGADAVIDRLDDFATRSGFIITPVVVWAGAARALTPNPAEVASVHRIPLTELLREDAPVLQRQEGGAAPVLLMPVGNATIAAPTAAILYQFREVCLLGRSTRVSHYEQPRFAWR